jgi:hypothetical protein
VKCNWFVNRASLFRTGDLFLVVLTIGGELVLSFGERIIVQITVVSLYYKKELIFTCVIFLLYLLINTLMWC